MVDFPETEPSRLMEEPGAAGRLLREALAGAESELDETKAFQRVERERLRRRGHTKRVVSYTALAAAFALGLFARAHWRDDRQPPDVRAEVLPPRRVPVTSADPQPKAAGTHESPTLAPAPRAVPSAPMPFTPSESLCRKWSGTGKVEQAIDCFRSLSKTGTPVEAEVALYEAARLCADSLKDPARALGLLDEHRKRFEGGPLRGEVAWLRIQCLQRMGRTEAALAESEQLLSGPEGRALASELHVLRGRLYDDTLHDCSRALQEFGALVGEPGPRGDEAEWRRARCLEALGRGDEAASAYEQYLKRSNVSKAVEARARLSELRP
jgi:tetratricopeptide (TPR) repeat protein